MTPTSHTAGGDPETAATDDVPGAAGVPAPAGTPGPAAPSRPESPRIRLARAAGTAAAGTSGVAELDRGPRDRYCTHAGAERLPGVVVIADGAPGTYDVALYVRAALVDLHDLADRIRAAVGDAATADGLADHLGAVRVAVTDIDDRSAFA